MDARKIIHRLCKRFGVPEDFGLRLRPLIERAGEAPPATRRRIMDLVIRSFAQERRERDLARAEEQRSDLRFLRTVASVLHGWDPPPWLDQWGNRPGEEPPATPPE